MIHELVAHGVDDTCHLLLHSQVGSRIVFFDPLPGRLITSAAIFAEYGFDETFLIVNHHCSYFGQINHLANVLTMNVLAVFVLCEYLRLALVGTNRVTINDDCDCSQRGDDKDG